MDKANLAHCRTGVCGRGGLSCYCLSCYVHLKFFTLTVFKVYRILLRTLCLIFGALRNTALTCLEMRPTDMWQVSSRPLLLPPAR